MTRPAAVMLLLAFAVVALFAVVAYGGPLEPRRERGHKRELGYGQVSFDGAGPERWAARYRREHRVAVAVRRALAARLARLVYLIDAFQCVHRYEGEWTAHTGNGFYGGLQMDLGFQRAYGRELLAAKGTADRWTPAEQMAVAITAHASRGFEPWPNTARMCGLR